ncbi:PP2C family protein-serine/threonine phosphatase [Gracilibacillus phocaeensis]|uniref:PP2C family protein-serine/threonine phosphatase n=1 Tax=Gracilibacillus phocaeensis TaxID=2042304 RepID=UPI00103145BE|nr:PP2C family serine/threonine-protein phosphatase [Gracilibacillus phocaeensis]
MTNTEMKAHVQQGKFSFRPSTDRPNQDSIGVSSENLSTGQAVHLFVIADGMGGHELGDAASYFAVDYVLKWWRSMVWMNEKPADFLPTCKAQIIDLFAEINTQLMEIGRREQKDIGTTLSVLMVVDDQYFICHIGDTRIYRYRAQITDLEEPNGDTIDLNKEKRFVQLSVDHSFASMQVEKGLMTTEEAKSHDKAHYLTQCMGIKGDVKPYTASGTFTNVDYFLLCTDGFHGLFTEEELSQQWTAQLEKKQTLEAITDHFYHVAKDDKHPTDDVSILTVHMETRTEG